LGLQTRGKTANPGHWLHFLMLGHQRVTKSGSQSFSGSFSSRTIRPLSETVSATYTRGNDLSGSLQGAGGIGGLLARTDTNGSTFYHTDGNGNITALMDGNENIVARYLYNPFGKLLGQWGTLANANTYRFSSREWNNNAGLYYYGRRYYDPNLQRWLNHDPIEERGGKNLYGFVANNPINRIDFLGLCWWDNVNLSYDLQNPDEPQNIQFGNPIVFDNVPSPDQLAEMTAEDDSGGAPLMLLAMLTLNLVDPLSIPADFFEITEATDLGTTALETGNAAAEQTTTTVLWSGGADAQNAATQWALDNGGQTLGMTPAGQALAETTQGMDYLTQARPLWESASEEFVGNASGEVHIFLTPDAASDSIYFTTEWPALLQNPNITSVIFHTVP